MLNGIFIKSSKRKTLQPGLLFFSFLFLTFSSYGSDHMINEKYLFSFKTNKSTCILRVNDIPAIENTLVYSGTISAGFNASAMLGNGSNYIELLMGGQDTDDPKTLFPDSSCELIISKDTKNIHTEIARFKLTVNEKHKITA